MTDTQKQGNEDAHHIKITHAEKPVQVTFGGRIIAETDKALKLHEPPMKPVHYIPREDVNMGLLDKTEKSTHCPFKGDASYFTITAGETEAENAVWSYESPKDEVEQIKDYLAFYKDKVEIIEK